MNIYLIDTENVGWNGLDGLSLLEKDDKVIIFSMASFMNSSNKIANQLLDCKASIRKIDVVPKASIKNWLDFQLTAILTSEVKENPIAKYFIISNDNGYKATIEILKREFNANVQLKKNIRCVAQSTCIKKTNVMTVDIDDISAQVTCKSWEQSIEKALKKYFASSSKSSKKKKRKQLNSPKTELGFQNTCMSLIDDKEKANEMYLELLPYFRKYKKGK